MWGNRISATKGFQQYFRVKNNVLSWFKRKTTQRSNKEKAGVSTKGQGNESVCVQLSISNRVKPASKSDTLYGIYITQIAFSLLLQL